MPNTWHFTLVKYTVQSEIWNALILFYLKFWFWIMMRVEIFSLSLQNLSDICGSKLYPGMLVALPMTLDCQIWSFDLKNKLKKYFLWKPKRDLLLFLVFISFSYLLNLNTRWKDCFTKGTKINPCFWRSLQQFTCPVNGTGISLLGFLCTSPVHLHI